MACDLDDDALPVRGGVGGTRRELQANERVLQSDNVISREKGGLSVRGHISPFLVFTLVAICF